MNDKLNVMKRYTILGAVMMAMLSPFALLSLTFTYFIGASKTLAQYQFAEANARLCLWFAALGITLSYITTLILSIVY